MDVNLYNFSGDRRTLNKYLTSIATVAILQITDETTILKPSIIIATRNFDFNYVYIASFGRYYYVDNIDLMPGNRIRINCSVDVLMSHRAAINASIVMPERVSAGRSLDDDLLPDNAVPFKDSAEVKIFKHNGGVTPFTSNSYVLSICGRN
jgi:hypothetical protein